MLMLSGENSGGFFHDFRLWSGLFNRSRSRSWGRRSRRGSGSGSRSRGWSRGRGFSSGFGLNHGLSFHSRLGLGNGLNFGSGFELSRRSFSLLRRFSLLNLFSFFQLFELSQSFFLQSRSAARLYIPFMDGASSFSDMCAVSSKTMGLESSFVNGIHVGMGFPSASSPFGSPVFAKFVQ